MPVSVSVPVPASGTTFHDADVWKVSGVTGEVNDDGTITNVRVDLNCDEMKAAYEGSCARAMASFEEFYNQVQIDTNIAATVAYADSAALNDSWESNPASQRIISIRLCIRWRWLRIYVIWKI